MKKICYVVTIPLTIRAFFIPQLKYLANNGFDVTVICSNDDMLQEELGKKIRYIPVDIPRGISLKGSIRAILNLIDIFKREQFNLVQYSTPNAALYTSVASKMVGVKVRNYHLMGYRYLGTKGIVRNLLKMVEKLTCILSTHIECVSKSNLELGVKEKLFSKEKATIVWNGSTGGVDLKRFDVSQRECWRSELRNQLGYTEKDFIYGFVGRITKDKGINELLKAFLAQQGKSKLILVGNMENEKSLDKGLVQQAKNSLDVMFHESVVDIERYYAIMDVLVLPSHREGFGNVVIEAGAVGTSAIVSEIPGPVDTIEKEKTAYTFKVKNVNELADAMKKIRVSDYEKMGENATKFVATKFDSNILNEKIMSRKRGLLKN